MKPKRCSAIVLAGGRSSRMGSDKASLPWMGATMLESVAGKLGRGFNDVIVVARANQEAAVAGLPASVQAVWDAEPWQGPVTALRIGLATARHPIAFVCACDLPLLDLGLALALCDLAARHDAAIPLVKGRLQVLHAAYRKSCLPALDQMIGRGERKLQDLAPMLDVRTADEAEMRRLDPELRSFFNVNTPDDYARALRLAGQPPRARH
jgi:molybdopterin-guanine dinucleotide biosynthesis protein A